MSRLRYILIDLLQLIDLHRSNVTDNCQTIAKERVDTLGGNSVTSMGPHIALPLQRVYVLRLVWFGLVFFGTWVDLKIGGSIEIRVDLEMMDLEIRVDLEMGGSRDKGRSRHGWIYRSMGRSRDGWI